MFGIAAPSRFDISWAEHGGGRRRTRAQYSQIECVGCWVNRRTLEVAPFFRGLADSVWHDYKPPPKIENVSHKTIVLSGDSAAGKLEAECGLEVD